MQRRILVVDDQESIQYFLRKTLESEGYIVEGAGDLSRARASLVLGSPDAIVLDLKLPDGSGMELLDEIRGMEHPPPVVMMTAFGDVDSSVKAMKLGAFDYVNKPIRLEELVSLLERAIKDRPMFASPGEESGFNSLFDRMPGIVPSVAPRMEEVYDLVQRISVSGSSTVLLTGESGVGKDVLANLVHLNSPRRDHAFLEINCASLPEALLESELFGHERGAFTDAIHEKIGLLQLAHRGTLFLDEIGEMSPPVQVKLLRVLEKMSFRRVGGIKDITVDVRIIAATNRNLRREMEVGAFREDLFYRLNVLPLEVPTLRDRVEDIPLLATHFLRLYSERFGKRFSGLSEAAVRTLSDYGWPGNIRELKNLMERVALLEDGEILEPEQIPLGPSVSDEAEDVIQQIERAITNAIPDEGLDFEGLMQDVERSLIEKAFRAADGNQSRTAKLLRLNRDKLRYRMKNFELL
jgi:DNA-binding NtrC family response regulator